MRIVSALCLAFLLLLSGCGYHQLGSATHLPDGVQTLAIPIFATKTDVYHTETVVTRAVVREFLARTRLRITSSEQANADARLEGTILREAILPLTYNASTQQSSSFLITVQASVRLVARDGRLLYQNDNYVFRQQYQSTTDLATFLKEDPAAVERLSRDFARQLVADVLEGF